jgi:hypothetical protein
VCDTAAGPEVAWRLKSSYNTLISVNMAEKTDLSALRGNALRFGTYQELKNKYNIPRKLNK